MDSLDGALRKMDFGFFGEGRHKIALETLLDMTEAVFVDLRSDGEIEVLPISIDWLRSIHIPLHRLPERWSEIPDDRPVGLFCSSDTRSAIALAYLMSRGYGSVRIVAGGYEALVEELKPGKLYARLSAGD